MKHFVTFIFALACASSVFAYDCVIDGIRYNLYSTNLTAEVMRGCNIDSIVIPSTITYNSQIYAVTSIGENAFYDCWDLNSITIPNSVITIGKWAFYGCGDLTSINIPNSVTTIGSGAFYGCGYLPVENKLRYADTYLVEAADNTLSTYTIKDGTKWIGSYAFDYCQNLTSIEIPNSVTTIGNNAFENCIKLASITIPNSVTTIENEAFVGCSGLTFIDVDAANTHYCSKDGVLFNYAKNVLIQYPSRNARTEYAIPNSVTTIENYAFFWSRSLTSIAIPNSVTTIGEGAFLCSGLTSVTIPNSVTTIGERAFEGCDGLTKTNYTGTIADWCKFKFSSSDSNPICYSHNFFINDVEIKDLVIPEGVDTIGDYAFRNCSGLTSVTIPNSVTSIGNSAFEGCSGLTSIAIPNSVTTIGYDAFSGCVGLTSVTIPNSVTTIGEDAFYNCSGLTSVTIPNSVTTIGNDAFSGCKGLTSITIGNSVTRIGDWAFDGCSGLSSITCEAAIPPACGYECFYHVDKSIPLYVPAGSVDAYKAAGKWKDFTDIRPITAQEVEVTEIEAEPTESAVEIAWPSVVNAETYTIEIRLGDQLICSIVFNAQGQLVSINFNLAPGRGGHTYATTAESTATGWAYTIAGLNPGTNYTYSVIAKNADEQVIDTKSGTFTTQDMPMDVKSVHDAQCIIHDSKFLRNGQILLERNNATYTLMGQKVR